VDNIKVDLYEIGWDGVVWNTVLQGWGKWWAFVNLLMNLRYCKVWGIS
jgi:hypothetical protein